MQTIINVAVGCVRGVCNAVPSYFRGRGFWRGTAQSRPDQTVVSQGNPAPSSRDNVHFLESSIMFDILALQKKLSSIASILPALCEFAMVAHAIAPGCAGLTKAGLVINTVIAIEPEFAQMEQILSVALTGVVNALRSAGSLPSAAPVTVAPAVPLVAPVFPAFGGAVAAAGDAYSHG